jgi:hypothetical protein
VGRGGVRSRKERGLSFLCVRVLSRAQAICKRSVIAEFQQISVVFPQGIV